MMNIRNFISKCDASRSLLFFSTSFHHRYVCDRCAGRRRRLSELIFNDHQSKRQWLVQQSKSVHLEMKQKSKMTPATLSVIQIWQGMTEQDLANVTGLKVDDVFDAMLDCDLDRLDSLDHVKQVTGKLQRKYEVIRNPKKIEIEPKVNDVEQLIRKHQLPLGQRFENKIPVVTIMGHVDHGKTTLLDALRESEIVKQEFGGITQHIGAFVVSLDDQNTLRKMLQANKKSRPNPSGVDRSSKNLSQIKDCVTFLDTPGHAAFSGMRERGARVTDLVVLVVAADDGVMQQTIESVEFARSNQVPIIVAINKIDKVANLDKVTTADMDDDKQQLKNKQDQQVQAHLAHVKEGLRSLNIVLEEDGGDVQAIKMSALKKMGLHELKEAILALSESLELNAPVDGGVQASIIESSLDEHRGKLTTVLVHSGTLKKGDVLLTESGEHLVKVRSMFDEYSNVVSQARPGIPVQVIGWKEAAAGVVATSDMPEAGERLIQIQSESHAKHIQTLVLNDKKNRKAKEFSAQGYRKLEQDRQQYQIWLEQKRKSGVKYHRMRTQVKKMITFDAEEERRKLNVILKADTYGTLETLLDILDSYPGEQDVKINLVHYGIGPVSDGDLHMASCFYQTRIYAFNVPGKAISNNNNSTPATKDKSNNFAVRAYNVIYHLVEDLKAEISSRLPEVEKHQEIGEAVVLQQFLINEKHRKYPVAGCRCNKGTLRHDPNTFYKLIRNGKVVADGLRLISLRHLKEEVKFIKHNTECGLKFDNPNVTFLPNDLVINYEPKKVKQKTVWTPKGFV